MYIENQASGHFPPPSLRTIRQPIAVWDPPPSVYVIARPENRSERGVEGGGPTASEVT